MSVNINYKSLTNEDKWRILRNGDFAILEGTADQPFPSGLYRIFIMTNEESVLANATTFILIPMFDGPFADGMFPYMLPTNQSMPPITHKISQVHIDVEVIS